MSLFFKVGDSRGHKGKILGRKECSEPIASKENEYGFLLFIPSFCLLGYQNIFPGSWQVRRVSEQRKSEGERGSHTQSENVRSARIPVGKID